jgi:hypothetical protein
MRITIEVNEVGDQPTVVHQQNGHAVVNGQTAQQAASSATDGGPPPEALVRALEAEGETSAEEGRQTTGSSESGIEVDGPPTWLRDVIDGGAAEIR